ncbi:unnamed protein product, partial [Mesorhabditis belari]|uniref:Uncharacterized protein n=1 Tax=Mesorhabditis belari TaxID=2138241 RepID=A0AAF3J5L8_9BILA
MAERVGRAALYWKNLYHHFMKKYPEQTIVASLTMPLSIGIAIYKIKWYNEAGDKPYYRGYYDVYRPNDPLVSYWRKSEEYPAPYLLQDLQYASGVQRD